MSKFDGILQSLTCPDHPADRLLRLEADGVPLLRCPRPECEYRRDLPIDQRYRAAGLPGLFDGLPA